ncbi:ran gtpase-activating protein 1 [Moniliophthora roreri MCA 2997]|uniref:Ran gtpase-activating protein 1 n=2 Tax=Moniliophthora roreri TaxID=221103 RepID=V2XQW2_MONRO|nr:ran gtpase-activating protein 1 [Moniliophthora roreri MCA 2997]KAI3616233.1 ran gtpase-activating protein 1 [Moniliophthora roreri]
MTSAAIFSLQGRGLKLDSRDDMAKQLNGIDAAKIEEIHLGGNTIGVDASLELAEFLKKAINIKVADFADIFTGRLITEIPAALTAICNALIDKTSLVEINLSDNAFGGRSVDPMVPFLTQNRSFQILKLNNNGLGPAGGTVLANALLESAKLSAAEGKKSNLRTFICGRNRLEDGSAPAWAEAFAAHGGLVEIRMPQNGIRMDGITALAKGLAKNADLQYIDLQDNTFTFEGTLTGVQAWSDALISWPELRTLNLSDCVLSGEGEVPSLVETLAAGSNPKLHTLQLQNNNLEAETFTRINESIQGPLKSLMSLELQWNDAEEDDTNLQEIGIHMKRRGGKLFVNDEDEEEEEKEEDAEAEADAEAKVEADLEEAALKKQLGTVKDEADDLAELMGKVTIK